MSEQASQSTAKQEATELNAQAFRWLASFGENTRPKFLPQNYPRIANRIALLWSEPTLMRPYLDELMVDGRGNREGFPQEVLIELGSLKHLYNKELYPEQTDVWSKILSQIS